MFSSFQSGEHLMFALPAFSGRCSTKGCAHLCRNHLVLLLVLLLPHPRVSSEGRAPVLGCQTLNSSTGCRKELFQTCRAALRTCAALRVFDISQIYLSVWWDSALTLRDRQSDTVLCLKWILASVISGCSIVTSTTNVAQT